MSAIKKQTSLRWNHQSELTTRGSVVWTTWTAKVGRFSIKIINYPGTRTLSWKITIPGTDWSNGSDEDRSEVTVSILKDRLFFRAEEMEKSFQAREITQA